jgi:hypothetical protein
MYSRYPSSRRQRSRAHGRADSAGKGQKSVRALAEPSARAISAKQAARRKQSRRASMTERHQGPRMFKCEMNNYKRRGREESGASGTSMACFKVSQLSSMPRAAKQCEKTSDPPAAAVAFCSSGEGMRCEIRERANSACRMRRGLYRLYKLFCSVFAAHSCKLFGKAALQVRDMRQRRGRKRNRIGRRCSL